MSRRGTARFAWLKAYSVVGEVIEGCYESHNTSVLAIFRLDALVGVWGVVLHVAQVEAWLVPPSLLLCSMEKFSDTIQASGI